MPIETYLIGFGKSFLFALATLLPILNPTATAPVFLSLTSGATTATRAVLATRIARNVFLLLGAAMIAGSPVLNFFGISLPVVRLAGGLLVATTAWRLLNSTDAGVQRAAEFAEGYTPEMARRQAFYPLTFPIACGPGSIAAAITVGASLHDPRLSLRAVHIAGALPALAVIAVAVFVCLRFALQLLRPLGETGTAVFMRMTAFILLCLGVQIMWDGVFELFNQLMR
ncbi:NAAT family transporter [Achromobacter sp. GG226]|uniref:MarC family protein n=1 Tax=Verticiella alkaliphila TaxID=2779529 RepID=UPI001C0CA461|nr:MarC family protein [Verticiella sp. GG226]MBU4610225.1 NAAT family transporter [Verticiella sp. GG226]